MSDLVFRKESPGVKPEYGQKWMVPNPFGAPGWFIICRVDPDGRHVDYVASNGQLWANVDFHRRFFAGKYDPTLPDVAFAGDSGE